MSADKKNFHHIFAELEGQKRPDIQADKYVVSRELYAAVKAAIATGQPLLLTGEPGTGKTRLAAKLAYDLSQGDDSFSKELLVFNTKSTSTAQDLFYSYDALRHFHNANLAKAQEKEAPDATSFINLEALGKAIAMTSSSFLAKEFLGEGEMGKNSVVLIDEIDKAPRDFTNDILHEIERLSFGIKELQKESTITAGKDHRIIVIMTSNSEKNLPEAFLRRCAFYHIPFPNSELLSQIVYMHYGEKFEAVQTALADYFKKIREVVTRKKPATAEFISWIHILEVEGFFANFKGFSDLSEDQRRALEYSLSVLVKTTDDLRKLQAFIGLVPEK